MSVISCDIVRVAWLVGGQACSPCFCTARFSSLSEMLKGYSLGADEDSLHPWVSCRQDTTLAPSPMSNRSLALSQLVSSEYSKVSNELTLLVFHSASHA
eukprot:657002-Amphidinium_carterae.1